MSADFKADLARGKAGEKRFAELVPGLEPIPGKGPDFEIIATGEMAELKTDSYDMAKTENFFFERYSDFDKLTPGGPWQALAKGAQWFYYFYEKNACAFRFHTATLVAELDEIVAKLSYVKVQNRAWTTVGFKVPRKILEHLYKIQKLKEE